jgi:choline dehydrogenase
MTALDMPSAPPHGRSSAADYVVIGGGSAGCVLARRLTDDGVSTVVLVEAGHDDRPEKVRDPAVWPTLIGTDVDWGFSTEPQAALGDRVLAYPRGRIIGGSSSTNGMMHMHGQRSNFDAWVAGGATEWSYDALRPFMDRVDGIGTDPDDGHVHLGAAPNNDFAAAVLDAMRSMPEFVQAQAEQNAMQNGERDSAADAHLTPAVRARQNLTILADTTASRVVFDGDRAAGVEVTGPAGRVVLRADREVILAAGAIASPQLLMLSGIGPADHLREFGIDVEVDAAEVGQGLQDHAQAGVTWETAEAVPSTTASGKIMALMCTDPASAEPDLQFMLVGRPYHPRELPSQEHGFTIAVSVLRPDSRGSVRLTGATVDAAPRIDPALLTDPRDVQRMITGLRTARRIVQAAALPIAGVQEALPGGDAETDEALTAFARAATWTYYHPVGTCRLGADPRSVVDQQLRVRGVTNLRVVDASVMPTLISANTNATTYVIAERAAALITAHQ